MIQYVTGDLFTCGIPHIAHGVNCQGVMGAGIATQFRGRWPDMYESYRNLCTRGELLPGDVMAWTHEHGVVFNLATQYEPGASAQTWMIAAAVGRMIRECASPRGRGIKQVAMPAIGCGIGGLELTDLMMALYPYHQAPVDLVIIQYQPQGAGS